MQNKIEELYADAESPLSTNGHQIINFGLIQSRGTLRRKGGKKLLSHHLYFCMRDFGYMIGDDAEVFFYLYNGCTGSMRQISERFSVFIHKEGYTQFNEKLHSNCCVFTDLGKRLFHE